MSSNSALAMDDIQARLQSFLDSSEFSDATIICGPLQLKVHKVILDLHSDYFAKAFQVDAFKEGNTGEIVLQAADPGNNDPQDACDDPDAVKQMIMYIYKHEYEDKQTLMMHAKIFAMAIKYQISGLCKCAASKFEYLLDKTGDRPADDDLCRVAYYTYHSTTDEVRELRDLVASELLARYKRLRDTPEGEVSLRSIPGVALDILNLKDKRQMDAQILCLRGHGCNRNDTDHFFCSPCDVYRPFCISCAKLGNVQYCKACGCETVVQGTVGLRRLASSPYHYPDTESD